MGICCFFTNDIWKVKKKNKISSIVSVESCVSSIFLSESVILSLQAGLQIFSVSSFIYGLCKCLAVPLFRTSRP